MWAMIPMFRTRSSATACSVIFVLNSSFLEGLPAVVREGLVGLRHPVDVVLALERAALLVQRVENLVGELVRHALLAALARVRDEPAHRQGAGAPLWHLDRHLVVRAADAAALHFEHKRARLDGPPAHLERRAARLRRPGLE